MKKIILIMIIISIYAFTVTEVKAESFYAGNFIPNVYVIKEKPGKKGYKQGLFIKRNSDNQFVYCLEPWVDLVEGLNYTTKTSNISDEVLNKASLIAYYGYKYGNHQEDFWYMVTQIAMWRVIDPSNDYYFSNSLNGTRINTYESHINEIYDLVNKHYLKPNFGSNEFKINTDKSLTISDSNKVLNLYNIKTTLNYERNGNNITFNSNEEISNQITFEKKDQRFSHPPVVYINDSSQNILSIGSFGTLTHNINVDFEDRWFYIDKLDIDGKDTDFTGTSFLLYNADRSYESLIVLNGNQHAIKNLPYGEYFIDEISTIEGYETVPYTLSFRIAEGDNFNFAFANWPIRKNITIRKLTNDNNYEAVEPGVSFLITGNNYEEVFITNEDGEFSAILPYGHYTIEQLTTTDGYDMAEIYEFNVDNSYDETFVFYNYKKYTNLRIEKVNENNELIRNNPATFKVTNVNTNESFLVTTNNEGFVIINNIWLGHYIITEETAPLGYNKDDVVVTISVLKEHLLEDNNELTVSFSNTKLSEKGENDHENTEDIEQISVNANKNINTVRVPKTDQNNWLIEVILDDKKKFLSLI